MALSITDSQGTKVFLGTAAGTYADANAAIAAGTNQIGCLQSLGEISSSRSVQEYSCLSSDETTKSLGSLSLGNLSIELLFDAADVAGQDDLRTAYAAGTRRDVIIQLTDGAAGETGTVIYFTAVVSTEAISIQKDNAVMYTVTLEIASLPSILPSIAIV